MICPSCDNKHKLFGSASKFNSFAGTLHADVLGELPLVPEVSDSGDAGKPFALVDTGSDGRAGAVWREEMDKIARAILNTLQM